MIAFDLECDNNHTFEGWFENSETFETQKARNLISCPVCGSQAVHKVLSPVYIGSGRKEEAPVKESKQEIEARQALKVLSDYIESNFEDVGANFAKEALKIHYGASEKRNIKGTSTVDEEETLRSEGVDFVKVPVLRHDAGN